MTSTSMAPEGYIPRVADRTIERYLSIFGAVEVSGTKWCGKTWTSLAHGKSVIYVDDDYDVAVADPALMTMGERPHVIDEWQLVPSIWDAVRRGVDKERGLRGGWILAGSSTPLAKDASDLPKHSGAGRIGRVRMFPMSLAESGDSACTVSLEDLFAGTFTPSLIDEDSTDARSLVEITCRGGWPEALGMDAEAAQVIAREYLRVLVQDTAPRHGRQGEAVSRMLSSISRTIGQPATQKTLFEDATGEAADALNGAQKLLVVEQLVFLRSVFLLEEIRGWVPPARSPKRLSTKPKRYLADSSLAIAQLGMGVGSLLHDWQTFGMMFENLCMRDLLVYASALPSVGFEPVRYYRDDSGLEVDAIVELADGRWAAFAIKTSEDKVPGAVDNLKRLKRKLCGANGSRTRPPSSWRLSWVCPAMPARLRRASTPCPSVPCAHRA